MKKFLKNFNTLYARLIISYIVTLSIVICIIYLSFFNLSTSHYEKEITFLNNELLGQLRQSSDDSVIGKVEKLIINSFLWGDRTKSEVFQDLIYLFDNPIEGNHDKIMSVRMYLQQIVSSQDDLIDSIVVYYKKNNLLISSVSMKYLDSKEEPFEKILDRSSTCKDAFGFRWINKDASDFQQLNQNNYKNIISLYCPYPFSGIDSNIKGILIINLKEEALFNIINGLSPNNFGDILISDNMGNVVLQNKNDIANTTDLKNPYIEKIIKEPNYTGSFTTKIGKENVVISLVPSKINNWIYIRIMPFEQYFSFSVVLKRLLIIICIATLLVGFIISNLFSFNMFKGIRKIIEISQNLFNINLRKDKDFYNKVIEINDSLLKLPYNRDMFKTSFDNNLPLIRYNLLVDLLRNKSLPEEQDVLFLKYFKINTDFPYDVFNVILIEYKNIINTVSLEKLIIDKEFIKYKISELITNDLLLSLRFEILDISTEQTVIIINFEINESSRIKSSIKGMFDSMKNTLNVLFTAAIGLPCNTIKEIYAPLKEASQCLKYNFVHPEKCFFDYDDVKSWDKINNGFAIEKYEDMEKQLRLNNTKSIIDLLVFSKKYIKENCLSYNYCQQILIEITNIFARYIHDMNSSEKETILQKNINEEFSKLSNIDEFFNWLERIVNAMEDYLIRKKGNRNQDLIEKVKEYIIKNLEKDLSLNSIADIFYINSSNLSKIFKEKTGINLIDFIVDLRIEKSKDMILSTHKSIEDIAAISGYNNTSYFIKKFKEKYGYTPKQYRIDHNEQIS